MRTGSPGTQRARSRHASKSPEHLVGREAECARIAELLEEARAERSGALVLAGEPGIGKSALCAWAIARADGMRVLTVLGVESEVDLPFAGLSELCADQLDHIELLPEPQARALEGALARRALHAGDRFAIGAALLSLLALVEEQRSVLVVVDDAQWLDAASTDALIFATRRLRTEGVAVLVATRPGATFDAEATGLPGLVLGGLEPQAARLLLEAAYGALPANVVDVLAAAGEGNPLALLEIPRLLSEPQLAGRQPIDTPLRTGPTLEHALLHRVVSLPAETRRGLVIAAASDTERLQPVVDAVVEVGLRADVLEAAERARVLSIAGQRFAFAHPLLRSAIYHRAPEPTRRAAHAALASVSVGESRVWHLARATVGEDEALAASLEEIGSQARLRGAPVAAASAFQRAARLTAPGQERARRLTEAASDAYVAGHAAGALEMLDEASRSPNDPIQQADIERVRGRILALQGEAGTAHRLLVSAAERVRDIDPERAAAILADACLDCISGGDIPAALATAREAAGLAANASPGIQAFAASALATSLALSGEAAEANALLDRDTPVLLRADPLTEAGQLLGHAAHSCAWLERYDLAFALFERLIVSARAASAPAALPWALAGRAELYVRVGQWAPGAADAEEAVRLSEQTAQPALATFSLDCLARIAAMKGREQLCRSHAERVLQLIQGHRLTPGIVYLNSTLGLLELGLGHIEPAVRHLESAQQSADKQGLQEPRVVQWQADLVEAHARARDARAAEMALESLERQAHSTGGRWTLGTAARCRGLLADESDAEACFAAALEHLEALPAPFEVARTHLCRGERLRRAGRRTDARHALRAAIEAFDRLGAEPWASRARQELGATGATARRRREGTDRDRLTPHELQVALIVATGASNREAAAALFLSPKTIEFHLSHIYSKLNVRTRSELAALAARHEGLAHESAVDAAMTGPG
jgi:DNA-binding CsgD family transcriptional regulator